MVSATCVASGVWDNRNLVFEGSYSVEVRLIEVGNYVVKTHLEYTICEVA